MVAVSTAVEAIGPSFFYPDMPLEQLRPSPMNPRKHFDEASLEELANNIREVGLLQPIVARLHGDHYEIVAGERRYRASQIAGLSTVPVSVKTLSDTQALEVMVIENNQREDINALEESDGFARLLEAGYDLDKLAERLGRSKKYIYDRMKLRDLAPQARQLLDAGKLTAGHAILLARLKTDDQARAISVTRGGAFTGDHSRDYDEDDEDLTGDYMDDEAPFSLEAYKDVKPTSVRELNSWIARNVRFNVEHAAAAAPLEYAALGQRVAEAAAKPGRGKKVIPITFEHYVQPEARDDERTYGPRSFKFADGQPHRDYDSYKTETSKTCEHAVLGVVAAGGRHYGQAFEVCIARDKCQVHWKKEIADRAKNQKLRDSGEGKKADKNDAKQQASAEARRLQGQESERRDRLAEARAINQIVDKVTELTPDLLRYVLCGIVSGDVDHEMFNARFKTKTNWRCGLADLKALSGRTLNQALLFAAISQDAVIGDIQVALKAFKVDFSAVRAAVDKEEDAKAAGTKPPVQTSAQKSKAKKKR
jgi:ParB/RepB/Spo0J family partition protein